MALISVTVTGGDEDKSISIVGTDDAGETKNITLDGSVVDSFMSQVQAIKDRWDARGDDSGEEAAPA